MTTFIRAPCPHTLSVWRFLQKVSATNSDTRLADLEHPSLKRLQSFFFGLGPNLCSPFTLQIAKASVPHECGWTVQRWPSYHWTRHRLPEVCRQHPHPWGFPDHNQHWVRKVGSTALNPASLNVRRLSDPSKCLHLLGELSNLCVNVAAVQDTHFTYVMGCRLLEDDFVVFQHTADTAALGSLCLLNAALIRLSMLYLQMTVTDVAVKSFEIPGVCSSCTQYRWRKSFLFQQLPPFVDDSKWLVLVGDWNAILDPKIDGVGC